MILLRNIKFKLLLLGTFFFGAAVIFYKFPFIPQNLAFDEVEFARLALSLKDTGYIPYSQLATGHATLYFYIILGFFNLFGINSFALRLPSAIFGISAGYMFYLIAKEIFKNEEKYIKIYLPVFLTFILFSMRWFFEFARFSFEAPFLLFLEMTSLYCMVRFLSTKRTWLLIGAGIFAGFAYNSYTPGRFFFIIPSFILLTHIFNQKFKKERLFSILSFLIPILIMILPLSFYIAQHGDQRVNSQLYLADQTLSPETKLQYFRQNLSSNALSLHIKGDVNGRHNYPLKPALNPILGILFLAGLIVTLKNIRNFYNQIFIAYFIVSFIPTLLTYPSENPHMLRTFTAIPSIVFITGNFLVFILKKWPYKRTFGLLFCVIVLSTFYELRTYFVYQTQVFPKAFEMKGELKKYIK